MTRTEITQDEINVIFPKVAETMADALGCDVAKVKPNASLIDELERNQSDFLDIVFRLERAFKVEDTAWKDRRRGARNISEAEFEKGGVVTEAGLQRVKEFLSEVPAERFGSSLQVANIPRLYYA